MEHASSKEEQDKVWDLIKGAHVAVLVTHGEDGQLDARPMGCVQREFDGTLWFMTFKQSPKLDEIARERHVLVSYAQPKEFEFVAVSGRARAVHDVEMAKKLWSEGLRVWFPQGPEQEDLALIAVDVEHAKYWTNPASLLSYGAAYIKARVTGHRPSPDDVADMKQVDFPGSS